MTLTVFETLPDDADIIKELQQVLDIWDDWESTTDIADSYIDDMYLKVGAIHKKVKKNVMEARDQQLTMLNAQLEASEKAQSEMQGKLDDAEEKLLQGYTKAVTQVESTIANTKIMIKELESYK
jgi:hypothetical protein